MIAVIIVPLFTQTGVMIDFKINQDFIAEVLCINKEKPRMTKACNGKCYLTTQLKKVEERENEEQAPINLNQRFEVVYYYSQTAFDFSLTSDPDSDEHNPEFGEVLYTSAFIEDVFHPPELI